MPHDEETVKKLIYCLVVFVFISCERLYAAEWQWSETVDSITLPGDVHPRAFLWIPSDCKRVRAVVFANNNMLEEGILEHPFFRSELGRLGIAEVFVTPRFDYWQVAADNNAVNAKFDKMLQAFAVDSGYDELTDVPIIPIGHSASATMPWDFAAWNPHRTLAILSVHGDAPQTRLTGNSRPNADWGNRTIDGIPGLMVMGEFEWWEDRLSPMFAFKDKYPGAPVALLADVGNGHFNSSDELVHFLTMFITKAVENRLPAKWPLNDTPKLKPVRPGEGWLVDRWHPDEPRAATAAPNSKYTGKKRQSFWCFDEEMALATENYYERQQGKKPQLLGIDQDGKTIPTDPKRSDLLSIALPPLDDSLTFHLKGTFLDRVPEGQPEKWSGLRQGDAIGHASGGGPIVLSRTTGPVKQLSPDTFEIQFNRLSIPSDRRMTGISIFAKQPGDRMYKSIVLPALLTIPARLSDGAKQTIDFPPIGNQRAGIGSLSLSASSSADAHVHYYVSAGPAEIEGNRLVFTKIPPRARLPMKVTVVAWQYGRTVEPKLQSAEPVERSFLIVGR